MIGAEDPWDLARTELTPVTEAYEAGDQHVSEMAAEAWSSLGLLEIQTAAGDSAALGQAVADLERAIETATPGARDDRRDLWYGFLGFAHCQLGRTTEAENAYTSAIELAPTDSIPDYQTALERSRNRTGLPRGPVTSDLWCREVPLEGCAPCPGRIPESSART